MIAQHRLVSLWDMYSFNGNAFVMATELMHKLIGTVEAWNSKSQGKIVSKEDADNVIDMLTSYVDALGALAVPVTKGFTNEAIERLEHAEVDKLTYNGCRQLFVGISSALRHEISASSVFVLDAKRSDFYQPNTPLFGAQVDAQFPGISAELDAAGKCYACDLPTAFAFHTIRCMEAGVRAVTRFLGIPDPSTGAGRNWSNVAKTIKAAMDTKWPTSASRMSGDGKDLEAIYGALVAMTNPYRNETMHLSAVYSATEAMHIFELIKGLMQKVASKMDESGTPV